MLQKKSSWIAMLMSSVIRTNTIRISVKLVKNYSIEAAKITRHLMVMNTITHFRIEVAKDNYIIS